VRIPRFVSVVTVPVSLGAQTHAALARRRNVIPLTVTPTARRVRRSTGQARLALTAPAVTRRLVMLSCAPSFVATASLEIETLVNVLLTAHNASGITGKAGAARTVYRVTQGAVILNSAQRTALGVKC
jgi:hypothetical protein